MRVALSRTLRWLAERPERRIALAVAAVVLALVFPADHGHAGSPSTSPDAEEAATPSEFDQETLLTLFWQAGPERRQLLERIVASGEPGLIPLLVYAMRLTGEDVSVGAALSAMTGAGISTWHEAYRWQEANPGILPHPAFRAIKLHFLGNTDPRFLDFFNGPGTAREEMRIRLEEITWGGVLVDGIPPLDRPAMIPADRATWLLPEDPIFGVAINGDIRAYPLRIMGWHEMLNDVVGGVPVALAYCTLCGAGVLYETAVAPGTAPFVFASSGLLYRSNKLMFDRETGSLWQQFTGEPVVGELAASGLRLRSRPLEVTTWADWRARHPQTTVLSLETGFVRDYGSGVTYRDYFASPDLMFPSRVGNERVARRKDFVFGMRDVGVAKAWPVAAFVSCPVINDVLGDRPVVLIGSAKRRSIRAYERGSESFRPGPHPDLVASRSGLWQVTEDALVAKDGRRLRRLPGRLAYWFAWDNHLGLGSELYRP